MKGQQNSLRTILCGLLCAALLLLGGSGQALQGRAWAGPNRQGVAVFMEPREDAETSGTLVDGAMVDILSEEEGWYKVSWTDDISTMFGFVRQEDLMPVPDWEEISQALIVSADGNPLPLYQGPDAGSPILGSYYPGVEVLAAPPEGEWARVVLYGGSLYGEGIAGYMRADGLRLESGGADVSIPFGELTGEAPVSILRRPDAQAQVLGPVEPGAQVRVMGENGDYLHVATGSFTGYVPKGQVDILSTTYSNMIPPLSEGRAFAVIRGEPGSTLQAYPFCEEKETGAETILASGSGLWVIRELGEWAQVKWNERPDMFVRSEWLDMYHAPSVFSEERREISLREGLYVVGDELPADAYAFRVPEGGQGMLEVRWPEGVVRQHTPVPGTIYNLYLPGGVSVTITGEGTLEPVDKTWIRSDVTWEFPRNATGRYIGGLNLEHGFVMVKLAEDETEGDYRVHRISQEAGEGAPGEVQQLIPGVERVIELEYGDLLEIVNGYFWTNG